MSSEISKAIEEQRVGLEEIGKAVTEFSQSIQINSSTAQSASKIANDLQQSFQALNELMSTLDSMMNGKGPKDSGQF